MSVVESARDLASSALDVVEDAARTAVSEVGSSLEPHVARIEQALGSTLPIIKAPPAKKRRRWPLVLVVLLVVVGVVAWRKSMAPTFPPEGGGTAGGREPVGAPSA